MSEILCHECGHSINRHSHEQMGCGFEIGNCSCESLPQDIAAAAVAEARRKCLVQSSVLLGALIRIREKAKSWEGQAKVPFWNLGDIAAAAIKKVTTPVEQEQPHV